MTDVTLALTGAPEPLPISIGQVRRFPGYTQGLRQPAVSFSIRISRFDAASFNDFDAVCSAWLAIPIGSPDSDPSARITAWLVALLERAGHPAFTSPRLTHHTNGAIDVILPCFQPEAAAHTVTSVASLANRVLADTVKPPSSTVQGALHALSGRLARSGLQGFNPLHFLRSANALHLPWAPLAGKTIHVGQGSRAIWLDSSFTDATSHLGTQFARNKKDAAIVLRLAGIPVPAHFAARSADDAVRQAAALGFPVVVKPADLDGGVGVAAHLESAEAVRKAWNAARGRSRNVLVEKHVTGRDYRVQIVLGEIQGIVERTPGGVTGNGRDRILILLARQNEERRTATDDRQYLHPIVFDQEAEDLLRGQGLNGDAIPEEGRFVRLRGAANVASGGTPVIVPLDHLHPDNATLVRRAAAALRLDVAGIDLLIPDISVSWLESGAHICEVNAQPQMFSTFHRPMLERLLPEGGRIPVVLFLGGSPDWSAPAALHKQLLAGGIRSGLAAPGGTWTADGLIAGEGTAYRAGRILVTDRSVDSIAMHVMDTSVIDHGWPVDQCNVLVVNGATEDRSLLERLIDACTGLAPRIVHVESCDEGLVAIVRSAFEEAPLHEGTLTHDSIAEWLAEPVKADLAGAKT